MLKQFLLLISFKNFYIFLFCVFFVAKPSLLNFTALQIFVGMKKELRGSWWYSNLDMSSVSCTCVVIY